MSSGSIPSIRVFGPASLAMQVLLVIAGSAALALAAKIQVPFWPVPMTMQTFVVLMIGLHFGPRLAGFSLLTYLAEGAFGLPVFSNGAGLAYLVGPTSGYLIGFFASAMLVAAAVQRGYTNSTLGLIAVLAIADAVIFGFGFSKLATMMTPEQAFTVGVLPFMPAEALKIALASVAGRAVSAFR